MSRTTGPEQHSTYKATEHKESLNFYVVSPDEIQPGDQYGYKIIMIVDTYSKTWWATRGLTHWSDDYVRDHGDKIREEVADFLFPLMHELGYHYRR